MDTQRQEGVGWPKGRRGVTTIPTPTSPQAEQIAKVFITGAQTSDVTQQLVSTCNIPHLPLHTPVARTPQQRDTHQQGGDEGREQAGKMGEEDTPRPQPFKDNL